MNREAAGFWLYRHRHWLMLPLLLLGLGLNFHALSVHRGNFMMIAGGVGVLCGTLLRIVNYSFIGARDLVAKHSPELITDGTYAVSRNPVHLAEAAIALGIAMLSRMPWLVLTTLVAGGIITALVIDWEEETLRRRYGRIYDNYCRIVPRWFSLRRLLHAESFVLTRGRVRLGAALRAESGTLLIGLLAILAFLAKTNIEIFF